MGVLARRRACVEGAPVKLAQAPAQYDRQDQATLRAAIIAADRLNLKSNVNVEFVDNKLILRSPNGTRYYLTVDNAGALGTTAVP